MKGTPTNFLVDTGAEFLVLKRPLRKLKDKKTIEIGATGQKPYPWTTDRKDDPGKGQVTHSFLVIPECPVPLLGRDLLAKLKAQISFSSEGTIVNCQAPTSMILAIKLEEEYRLHDPQALAAKTAALALIVSVR